MLLPIVSLAQSETISIDSDWQYRWGDSAFSNEGIPKWIVDEQDKWSNIKFPSNPPNRDGKTNVWYRTSLPSGVWHDPVLYIYSVDLITEVYMEDGRQIYHYGSFDEYGQGRFEGWPWHMIELPDDFSGKSLYFRIFSSAADIGLWGEVKLMERVELLKYIVNKSITDLLVTALSFLISLLALVFALVQENRRTFFLISFFTISSSFMLFAQTPVKQLLFNAPLFWDYVAATSYFVLPVAMAMLFDSWHKWKFSKIIKAIWKFHLAFVIVSISSSLAGVVELSSMYYLFDILFTISLLLLFIVIFTQFKSVRTELKVVFFAFALFNLFLLIDMGVAHNILPWTRMPIAIGLLIFSITMVSISLKHIALVQLQLKELNETLEKKVEDRTEELKRIASTDPLTMLMNRRAFYIEAEHIFSKSKRYQRDTALLMLDIDFFKQFNDRYGHAVGDAILVALSRCMEQVCRETDLPARFGGEEFVVLLEEADKEKAMLIAERLRQSVSDIKLDQLSDEITVSIGISILQADTDTLDALIIQADKAMYKAKNKGRNNCQIT